MKILSHHCFFQASRPSPNISSCTRGVASSSTASTRWHSIPTPHGLRSLYTMKDCGGFSYPEVDRDNNKLTCPSTSYYVPTGTSTYFNAFGMSQGARVSIDLWAERSGNKKKHSCPLKGSDTPVWCCYNILEAKVVELSGAANAVVAFCSRGPNTGH